MNQEKTYTRRIDTVKAREIPKGGELVECYNGTRHGNQGDFIVCNEYGRVMIVKRDKFLSQYEEMK